VAGSAADFVQNSISGGAPARPSGFGGHDYSANLDQQPEAFMAGGDDDSDEDIGKPAGPDTTNSEGLDYDSDEKNDEELVAVSGSTQSNELIDLSGGAESGAG